MELSSFPEVLKRGALKRGAVFRMNMSEEDGITPKHGDDKQKRFVVIATDEGRLAAASLIINSEINRNLFNVIAPYQHEIYRSDYDFLDHDSYIDGFTLHEFSASRILSEADFIGVIDETDIQESVNHLVDTGKVKPVILKRYNLQHS